MPQSSTSNPLPVVTTLERLSLTKANRLRNYYHKIRSKSSSSSRATSKFTRTLIIDSFRFLGTNYQRFPKCFTACLTLCRSTKAMYATRWNTWEGFSYFLDKMQQVERLTRHTNKLHCPSAAYLVVAVAMQQVILYGKIGENDKVSNFLSDFGCHNTAATAIYFYEMDYRQEILTLDQEWDMTPFAIQRPPNHMIHQLDASNLDQRRSNPRVSSPSRIIILDDEEDSVKPEPPAHESSGLRYEMREEEILRPAPVPAPEPMPTSIHVPISMPVPVQMPAQLTMLAPLPNAAPTSVLTLRPVRVRETLKEVFRQDIMTKLQPLLDRLKSENGNGINFMEILTDKNVRVLPSLAKQTVRLWATRSQNAMLLSWLEQARDDVDVFQWTERFNETTPSTWTNPQSAHSVFHDLDAIITRVPQMDVRGLLQAKMSTLRDIFDQQEKSHKDEMMHRVDSLQMDIAKLHGEMAASKQMDGRATGESAAIDNDTAMADEDVAIDQTDEDATEDSEVERKKKKRKGEKKERKSDKKGGEEKAKKDKKKKTKSGENDKKKKKRCYQEMELN
ncbi:hypothetical protein V8C34DRAFT_124663 [Trichoderma compactum]